MSRFLLCAPWAFLIACGAVANVADPEPIAKDSGADRITNAVPDSTPDTSWQSPTWDTSCPLVEPSAGDACGSDGGFCEYGVDPNWQCNAVFQCSNGRWWKFKSGSKVCPSAICDTQDSGLACDLPDNAVCYIPTGDDGYCTCVRNSWDCYRTQNRAECPTARPHFGAACETTDGSELYCGYAEGEEYCSNGQWWFDFPD